MNPILSYDFIFSFKHLQQEVYFTAKEHGFHEQDTNALAIPTYLALVGTEVSEAIEAHRKNESDKFPSELADIVIRTMDIAEAFGINLGEEIIKKAEFNATRSFKHGNRLY